jgi:cell division protein FtsB
MGDKHEPQISANAKLREERNSARRQVDTLIAENLELKAAVSALKDQCGCRASRQRASDAPTTTCCIF